MVTSGKQTASQLNSAVLQALRNATSVNLLTFVSRLTIYVGSLDREAHVWIGAEGCPSMSHRSVTYGGDRGQDPAPIHRQGLGQGCSSLCVRRREESSGLAINRMGSGAYVAS